MKPLHIATFNDGLVFASEHQRIHESETIAPTVDTEALRYFLQMRYSPHRSALFEGIEEVPAGQALTAPRVDGALRTDDQPFWHPAAVSGEPPADPAGAVRAALGDAVERQLVRDRPVGLYLSGGLDTSSVVALASEITDEPIHTFCMGFRDAAWD